MRLSSLLLGVPVVAVAAVVAVANREMVSFSLDPFSRAVPALTFEAPLFLLLFAAVGLGVVLGAGAALLSRAGKKDIPAAKAGGALLPKLGPGPKPPAPK
ncbi:MAG: DUF1049 domain-containing protein [Pseudomonadota bacterium]|nr:DUF1049 domain-containing protein [Pseudomonadota bacterium]